MAEITRDINYTTGQELVIGVDAKTSNVLPTTATAYKRGDVVVVDGATNVATHPETATGYHACLLYTSPSPRDGLLSRMPSSA